MGALDCCAKAILITINLLITIIGILILVVGCVVKWGQPLIEQYVTPLLSGISGGNNASGIIQLIQDLLDGVALGCIIVGAILFVIGCLGCCGACCEIKFMLVLYSILVGIILLAQIALIVVIFTMNAQFEKYTKNYLELTIKERYKGTNSTDAISLAWTAIQTQLKCCGVSNYTDFYLAENWNRNASNGDTLMVPLSCCKMNSTDVLMDNDCPTAPTTDNANIDKGCYSAVATLVEEQKPIVIGVSAGVMVFEVIVMVFAIYLCRKASKVEQA